MVKKRVYYHHNSKRSRKQWVRGLVISALALFMVGGGIYLWVLTQSPNLPISTPIDLNTSDDATDNRNRIQIEKLNLEVPFFDDNTPATLEKGVWWRFPDRGNPEKGGNFILSAHRFYLGTTPQGTRARSPFYKLDKLVAGDKVRIFYNGKWYDYEVTKDYSVKPEETSIEDESSEAKLTLYTCTLKGSADGRVVIEAKPLF